MEKYSFPQNDYVVLWSRDKVCYMMYKDEAIVGIDAARKITEFRRKVFPGEHPYIIYLGKFECISPEAVEFLVSEGTRGMSKTAYVAKSFFSELIGNVLSRTGRSTYPAVTLNSEASALQWIRGEAVAEAKGANNKNKKNRKKYSPGSLNKAMPVAIS